MKIIGYKYKLKPTEKQKETLNKAFGCSRFIYNWGLRKKIKYHKQTGGTLSHKELMKQLTGLKRTESHKWLNEVSATVLQKSLINLDYAFSMFFQRKRKFPKFKSKKYSKKTAKYDMRVSFNFSDWKVKIPMCGAVKLCKSRQFDTSSKIGTLTVTKDKCEDYWCSILISTNDVKPKVTVNADTAIGIDLGIKTYITLSNGIKIENPKYFEKAFKRIRHLQRIYSRTEPDSKRHIKTYKKFVKLHRKIYNRRIDFLHKVSSNLVNQYDTLCFESLCVSHLLKDHKLSIEIHSASWREFIQMVKYKAEQEGKNVLFIDRWVPSSKTCSNCGYIKNKMELSEREWVCPKCGQKLDRDVNAAINIKNIALQQYSSIGE